MKYVFHYVVNKITTGILFRLLSLLINQNNEIQISGSIPYQISTKSMGLMDTQKSPIMTLHKLGINMKLSG
jgi:hypothetical protein